MNKQALVSLGDDLISNIKDLFPESSEFESQYNSNKRAFECTIYWHLNNDEARPQKLSRIILIVISNEALEEFHSRGKGKQKIAQEKFERYIKEKLKLFSPDHNESSRHAPPVEEWLIDNNLLNY